MPNRDLNVNVDGDPKGFERAIDRAAKRLEKFEADMDKADKRRESSMGKLGDATAAIGDSVGIASGAFSDMFGLIEKAGPGSVALLVGAIEALPLIASLAATGVVFSFGSGLAGLGIAAVAQTDKVKSAFEDLKFDVVRDLQDAAAPLEKTLLHAADVARDVFGDLKPALADAFEAMAPGLDHFIDGLGEGISGLGDLLEPLGDSFGRMMANLGDRMPEIMGNIDDMVQTFIDMMNEDPQMLANLAADASELLAVGAEVLSWADEISAAFNLMIGNGKPLADLIMPDWLNPEKLLTSGDAVGAVGDAVAAAQEAMSKMSSAAGDAGDEMADLSAALKEFFDPAAKALDAEIRLKEALQNATKAAKDQKLSELDRLKNVQSLTTAIAEAAKTEKDMTGGTENATKAFKDNIGKLIEWSGKNDSAKAAVQGLADSLGVTIIKTKDGTTAVDKFGNAVKVLPNGKVVKIDASTAEGKAALAAFLLYIARQKGTVDVHVRTIYDSPSGKAAIAAKNRRSGGIDRYASGGVRRSVGPNIASGPTVLYGEGAADEAFIPYEMKYRSRAKGLLNKVAADFGMGGSTAMYGGGEVTVRLVADGADTDMLRMLRKMVRAEGRGNVQTAFGR